MKVALAVTLAAGCILGALLISTNSTIRQQDQKVRDLTSVLADKSKQQALAEQSDCAAHASRFLASRGWKPGSGDDYENHFNPKLNKCFVLVTGYLPNEDFRTYDLYDAVEGRRYATYNGHSICSPVITGNPRKCAMDSGSIWFDGNDSRTRADFTVGFRGLLNGGGAGDEETQKTFLDRVRQFMSQ